MKDNVNGIIGGSGSGQQQADDTITLLPCPCGDDAAWYFTGSEDAEESGGAKPAQQQRRRQQQSSVGALSFGVAGSGDDTPPNLCDSCFVQGVPPAEQTLWTRLELPERQQRSSSRRRDSNEGDQTQGGRVWQE